MLINGEQVQREEETLAQDSYRYLDDSSRTMHAFTDDHAIFGAGILGAGRIRTGKSELGMAGSSEV